MEGNRMFKWKELKEYLETTVNINDDDYINSFDIFLTEDKDFSYISIQQQDNSYDLWTD
jgi:hypothetical protein